MLKRPLRIKNSAFGIPLAIAALLGILNQAGAAQLRGFTVAPDWSLGSPQVPGIRLCSDIETFCTGSFGLGGLSDVLDFTLRRRIGTATRWRPECGWNIFGVLSGWTRIMDQAARSIGLSVSF